MRGKRKTQEQFVKEVYGLVGDEYTVLGQYINDRTKILMRHNKCGHEWEIVPNNILRGSGCPICRYKKSGKTRTKTTEKFKEEVYDLVGNEYTILGEYEGAHSKILMKHNKCGYEYSVTPASFLQGRRCTKCGKYIKRAAEGFKKEVFNLYRDEYIVLGEYIGANEKVKMRHNICGHEWGTTTSSFLNGKGCPKCFGHVYRKTTEQFKKEVYDLVGEEYSVLGEYVNNKTGVKIRHNECGHEWESKPNDFLRGNRCPKCRYLISKGEKKIMNYLRKNKIPFSYEHKFEDLKDKKHLRFDFYLKDYNLCIEYDGKQHFEPHDFSGNNPKLAEEKFKITCKHDEMKKDYCDKHSIQLLRIPYNKFSSVEKILKSILNR